MHRTLQAPPRLTPLSPAADPDAAPNTAPHSAPNATPVLPLCKLCLLLMVICPLLAAIAALAQPLRVWGTAEEWCQVLGPSGYLQAFYGEAACDRPGLVRRFRQP